MVSSHIFFSLKFFISELNKSKADTNISSIYGVNEVLTEKFGPINYGPIHN